MDPRPEDDGLRSDDERRVALSTRSRRIARRSSRLFRWSALFALALTGCPPTGSPPDADGALPDGALPFDGALLDGGGLDAATSNDASTDANVDAGRDAGIDAAIDANVDAPFDCGSCTPSTTCSTTSCTTSCVYSPVADGTVCGAADICVAGACVMRGCGDGYREPVTTSAATREGCDDGNHVDGDACSPTCEPTPFVVAPTPMDVEGTPTAQLPAIAESGDGTLLFVWLDSYNSGGEIYRRLLAARYDAAGNALTDSTGVRVMVLEDPIGISQPVRPSVAGLARGWVVTWRSTAVEGTTGEQGDIAYRMVSASGVLSSVRQANTTTELDQLDSRVAPLASGFVIVWTDTSLELTTGDLRMRFFGASGIASGGELAVTTTTAADQSGAFVASRGTAAAPTNEWVVAWTDTSSGTPRVALRRFGGVNGQLAVDAADVSVSDAWGYGPALAVTGAGTYIAWTSRRDDTHGDAWVRFVADGHVPSDDLDVDRYALTFPSTGLAAIDDAPAVSAFPFDGTAGYVAIHATNQPPRGGRLVSPSSVTRPPEAAALSALLRSAQTAFSLTPTDRGLWAAWSDPTRTPAPSAFVAYLMPWE